MSLSCGMSQRIELRQEQSFTPFGDEAGDIPVYSLHRIRRRLDYRLMGISHSVTLRLVRHLLKANEKFVEETGKNWKCLSTKNFIEAMEGLEEELVDYIDRYESVPVEYRKDALVLAAFLREKAQAEVDKIKSWFDKNYDDLRYNMEGKIPWPIVQRLRRDFSRWALGFANPFSMDIEEMIMEVAEEGQVPAEDAQEAWVRMGGAIFSK